MTGNAQLGVDALFLPYNFAGAGQGCQYVPRAARRSLIWVP
jgi:hypothetical protein